MKRQFRNAISSFVIAAFAGIGLVAFGQNPCGTQTVVPVPVVQTVEQTCPQPVVQTVEQTCTVVQTVEEVPCAQPVQTVACEDLCELVTRIEDYADDLRKDFKNSLKCLECADDSYYDSVREFERATDRLKRRYRRSDCEACDVTAEVQEVLSLANCISAYMDPCSICPEAISAWTGLQADLQQLAGQYCTNAAFQQPVSLACPVPACVQPVQPVQFVQPVVQPQCVQPAPVVQPVCPANGEVIYK